MSDFLKAVNIARLIEKLDGNDERFAKMESAAQQVAKTLQDEPHLLIRAVLAGLDPDIPVGDPAIEMAEKALIEEWTSIRSVHPDPPIFIYRAILLDACDQLAEQTNAVILWNTVADTLPLMQLGKEEAAVSDMLTRWAKASEEYSLVVPSVDGIKRAPTTRKNESFRLQVPDSKRVDKENIKQTIAAASGPNYRTGGGIAGANPHWSNQAQSWSWEYTDRMTELLSIQFDNVYKWIFESQTELANQIAEHDQEVVDTVKEILGAQRSWLQDVVKNSEKSRKAEHLRLNTLWWCEALYSPTMCCSYRELDPFLASALMVLDLLGGLETPVPASVGYALAETVNKLPEMAFGKEYDIREVLERLAADRGALPPALKDELISPPEAGRLSLRDMLIAVIQGDTSEPIQLMKRAGLAEDHKTSLPKLSQAFFRQEQAVRLAEG